MNVRVHEIATDGLPDFEADHGQLVGRVAFIFDGSVVSGWPLRREHAGRGSEVAWEADSDVGRATRFEGVTHWLEFPTEIWNIAEHSRQ